MATDLFLSHASQDHEIAGAVLRSFEDRGATCWIAPRDVAPGSDYGAAIVGAIRASEVFVLVFSEAANLSQHVLREVDRALEMNKPVVPIKIDQARPSDALDYRLCTVQWLDAGLPIPDAVIERTLKLLARPPSPHSASSRDASIARTSTPDDQPPPRKGSRRSEQYREFWRGYLERVRAEHPDWTRAKTPSDKHWMSAKGPIPGTLLMPLFRQGGVLGHDLYIDTGDKATTSELYRRLLSSRHVLEEAYGQPLEWLELPDRRACRIADQAPGSVDDVERHAEFVSWFIERGERFRAALGTYLQGEGRDLPAGPPPKKKRTFAEALGAGTDDARDLDQRLQAWSASRGYTYDIADASRGLSVHGHLLGRLYPQWNVFALRLKTLMSADLTDAAAEVRGLLAEVQPDSVAAVEPNLACDVAIEHWEFVEAELLPVFAAALETLAPRN